MPTESDLPTTNSAPDLVNPAETDQVFLYPVYFEGSDDKATVSTPGKYFELPLPPDLVHLGWPVTDEEGLGLICNLCEEQGAIRWLKNPRSAAKHLSETHNLAGEGIAAENTRPATEQEAKREGDIDVGNMPPVDPTIDHLYFSTETVTVGGTDQVCLRLATADEIDADSSSQWQKRKIKAAADPRQNVEKAVRIPAIYTNPNIGGTNPFHPSHERIMYYLEIDWKTEQIRVWPQSVSMARSNQLYAEGRDPFIRAPLALGLVAESHRAAGKSEDSTDTNCTTEDRAGQTEARFVDLAAHTDYEGQRFEIIPVDGMHPLFYQEALNQRNTKTLSGVSMIVCDETVFKAVAAQRRGDLPPYTTAIHRLRIMWEPTKSDDGEDEQVLFDTANVHRLPVILPAHGSFNVRAWPERPDGDINDSAHYSTRPIIHRTAYSEIPDHTKDKYTSIGGDWFAIYVDSRAQQTDQSQHVYLPLPQKGQPSEKRVVWYP